MPDIAERRRPPWGITTPNALPAPHGRYTYILFVNFWLPVPAYCSSNNLDLPATASCAIFCQFLSFEQRHHHFPFFSITWSFQMWQSAWFFVTFWALFYHQILSASCGSPCDFLLPDPSSCGDLGDFLSLFDFITFLILSPDTSPAFQLWRSRQFFCHKILPFTISPTHFQLDWPVFVILCKLFG